MVRDKYLDVELFLRERVHHLYYDQDINCARTTLLCLGELFNLPAEPSVLKAAIGHSPDSTTHFPAVASLIYIPPLRPYPPNSRPPKSPIPK